MRIKPAYLKPKDDAALTAYDRTIQRILEEHQKIILERRNG